MEIIDFKATKCKHCYKCVHYCEVKIIQVKDERAIIMPDKCILCGHCLKICPQSAKILKNDLNMVHGFLCEGMRVVMSITSSCIDLLRHKTIGQMWGVLLRLRFEDVREASEGAALVTTEHTKLLAGHRIENIIITYCPSANDLVEIHYPQPIPYLAPVVSPMIIHGGLLKEGLGCGVKVMFLGPCIAKKKEAMDLRHEGYIDAILNFNDTNKWLEEGDIVTGDCEDRPLTVFNLKVNRLYSATSDVANPVLATEEKGDGYREPYVHGEDNCIDLCESMSRGEIKGCFMEMNMRSDGCIKDPAVDEEFISRFKARLDMEENICRESAEETRMEPVQENVSFRKQFKDHSPRDPQPMEEQIRKILRMTNKLRPEGEPNCSARGYPTCREKAIAVLQHRAEVSMCIPFMHEKVESVVNLVMEISPNIVLIVGDDIHIMEYSDVGRRYFGRTRSQALQIYLYEFIDPVNFQWVFGTHQDIRGKRANYLEYNLSILQNIVCIEEEDAVLVIFIDITREEELTQEKYERKLGTIDLAQEVIHKQVTVAQEIADLLGETTAGTKTTLTKSCHSLLEDGSDAGYAGGEREREIPGVQLGSRAVPLKGVMTARGSGGMEAGQTSGTGSALEPVSGAGNPADNVDEQKKPTGYVHIDSASPGEGKFGYVRLSNVDLEKPGGNGGK